MKKKTKKHNQDFFSHAKEVMGEKRYARALKKGQAQVNELRLKMAREMIGLNQSDLKGMTQPEVSKIEKRKDLKISTLNKYAKSMGMKVKISLVSEDDDQQIAIYG
ncbi:toxin-antitoxin system, antitoxin component, Xre domain protein [Bacteriovorax sp. BSW11_IV]|uniref:helix-turn-helix domain-containing protein n=1 Tax=Bacteriovorax sp. BSW11_IV TaxID=1353529 RepID=UPI00038A43FA|nr:helix-turn-helix transcriptional regulator [Bacteriovorax sp. BSW11_IV]EQC48793.1 toxin-antitoxin system, antitoxin component, Xre domain protein [Bacteriovorax sp. BSW11_IV]